jgi:taurine transport system permease protein
MAGGDKEGASGLGPRASGDPTRTPDNDGGAKAPEPTWKDAKDAAEVARAKVREQLSPKKQAKRGDTADPASPARKKPVPMYGDGNRETVEKPDGIARPPSWWKRLRTDPPFPIRILIGSAMVAAVVLIWFSVTHSSSCPTKADPARPWDDACGYTRAVSPSRLPSPGEVWDSIGGYMIAVPAAECTDTPTNGKPTCMERRQSIWDRSLSDAIFATLERVFLGVFIAALVGISLGVIAGSIRAVNAALAPLVIFLRSVPMAPLLFLTLLLFGGGERQKTMYIFLAVVAFVFSDTLKAVAIVPERYVETAQTLGASRLQIILKVLVPLAIPDVITSLRFQFGLALGYITLAESLDQTSGLGAMIEASNRQGPRTHTILLLFIIAFIAYGIDLVLRTIQRGAFRWRRDL